MPLERVKHQLERTNKLAPRLKWERDNLFLLVRFADYTEEWFALRDLEVVTVRYEVVGFARRV